MVPRIKNTEAQQPIASEECALWRRQRSLLRKEVGCSLNNFWTSHLGGVPGSHRALYQAAPGAPLAAARVPRRPWTAPTTIPGVGKGLTSGGCGPHARGHTTTSRSRATGEPGGHTTGQVGAGTPPEHPKKHDSRGRLPSALGRRCLKSSPGSTRFVEPESADVRSVCGLEATTPRRDCRRQPQQSRLAAASDAAL